MPWHDFGVVWLEYFYAVALELGGADYLDEVLAQTYEPAFDAGFPRYAAMSDDELVREIAAHLELPLRRLHACTRKTTASSSRSIPAAAAGGCSAARCGATCSATASRCRRSMPEPHQIDFNRATRPPIARTARPRTARS